MPCAVWKNSETLKPQSLRRRTASEYFLATGSETSPNPQGKNASGRAAQYLKQSSAKVGVVGFCMGGALTVLSAMYVKEANACSSWYGFPPEQAGAPKTIRTPLQLHLAEKDQAFSPDAARVLEGNLKAGNVPYESHWYDAGHAFFNEKGPNYNAACAKLAWERTSEFFAKHLK